MNGQGALEYLMTYGWVLLIIVVVGASLYVLGIIPHLPPSKENVFCKSLINLSYGNEEINCYEDSKLFSPNQCFCKIKIYDDRNFFYYQETYYKWDTETELDHPKTRHFEVTKTIEVGD